MKKWIELGIIIFILQTLAFLTSFFLTENAVSTWYQDLAKSPLNPPDATFPIVWTTLYAMIAVSLWYVWRNRARPYAKPALAAFAVQLVANYAWSPVFFGMQAYTAAFYLCLFIVAAIAANIFYAWRVHKPAALLLVPYMAWTAFAAHLTYYVMTHN